MCRWYEGICSKFCCARFLAVSEKSVYILDVDFESLPAVSLHNVWIFKIHIWVAVKREAVIKGIIVINTHQEKHFKRMFWLALAQ